MMVKFKTDVQTIIIVFLNALLASLLRFYSNYSLLQIVAICIITSVLLKITLVLTIKK